MPDPATFRDSTQIVLPEDALTDVRESIESEFTVTVCCAEEDSCRIIGSPVEIKRLSNYLARRGVSIC